MPNATRPHIERHDLPPAAQQLIQQDGTINAPAEQQTRLWLVRQVRHSWRYPRRCGQVPASSNTTAGASSALTACYRASRSGNRVSPINDHAWPSSAACGLADHTPPTFSLCPLSPAKYHGHMSSAIRRKKLRSLIKEAQADALLVTNFKNVTYLTGFTGDDSYLLVTLDGETLITDPRYTTQLEEECPGLALEIRAPGVKMLTGGCQSRRARESRAARHRRQLGGRIVSAVAGQGAAEDCRSS